MPDAEVAQALIRIARPMYASEDLGLDLDNTVFALDASTIDLCLSMFPWAPFQSTKAAVKLHTLLDLRGPIPTFLHVSDGKMADVHALDRFVPEPGAFYVMDRAYLDFERLYALAAFGAFFVIRAKSNTVLDSCRRRVGADSCPVRPVALDLSRLNAVEAQGFSSMAGARRRQTAPAGADERVARVSNTSGR